MKAKLLTADPVQVTFCRGREGKWRLEGDLQDMLGMRSCGAAALLASAFVASVIGNDADLGANAPDYSFPLPLIFGIEVLASALLMAVILYVVYTKGLRGFSGIAIGGIIGLDILFLAFISGASMNPARALAPAVFSGVLGNLWLYWSATFAGTSIVALLARKRFKS